MSELADAGRFLAFALLTCLLFYALYLCLRAAQQYEAQEKTISSAAVALLGAVLLWVGIFVAIVPITGVISVRLLLTAFIVAASGTILGWAAIALLGVRRGRKSSFASANALVFFRHPWLVRVGMMVSGVGAMTIIAVFVEGLIVLVVNPADREATMVRLVFVTLFVSALPTAIYRALLLTMPVLDENSRDHQLAGGFAGVITQALALSLLVSSLNGTAVHVPFRFGGSGLSVSAPLLLVPLAYFIVATALPYGVGLRGARRLREGLMADEEEIKSDLERLLAVPNAALYDFGLADIGTRVSAQVEKLKESYFYLSLAGQPAGLPRELTAGAVAAGAQAEQPDGEQAVLSRPAEVVPGEGDAVDRAPDSRVHAPVSTPSGRDLATVEHEADAGREVTPASYGEAIRTAADEMGWSRRDARRQAVDLLADSFENQARYVDPAFIHWGWLERVEQLVAHIRKDLDDRPSRREKEGAALSWSRVAALQEVVLSERPARLPRQPRAVVVITSILGVLLTALVGAAVTDVWNAFVHAAH